MTTTVHGSADIFTDLQGLQDIKRDKNSDEALKKVAGQFESMFISMMIKSARSANAAFEEGSLFQSKETQFYRDMYDQQLSLSMAHKKSLGIADALYRQMSHNYGSQLGLEQSAESNKTPSLNYQIPDDRLGKRLAINYRTGTTSHISGPVDLVYAKANQQFSAKSPEEFIRKLFPFAQASAAELAADPNMLIAQSALETGWGKSIIKDDKGQSSNNLFNIKANSHWQGDKARIQTREYYDKKPVVEMADFRAYSSVRQSFEDYVSFLKNNPRYQKALSLAANASDFIRELHAAGYATDPHYSEKAITIFERVKQLTDALISSQETKHHD